MRSIFLLFVFAATNIYAQGYHFEDTKIVFTKDISFGTVHGYLPIFSDTTDTLAMRWIARKPTDFPQFWNINFDDQTNYYPTIEHLDSGDFDLYPPQQFDQKLIIGLAHNGQPDTSSIFFTVFPLSSRADSTVIEYEFRIASEKVDTNGNDTTDTNTFIQELSSTVLDRVHFNGTAWEAHLMVGVDALRIYDLNGRLLFRETDVRAGSHVLPSFQGVVIMEVWKDGQAVRRKLMSQP